jgi:hypothetical protein
MKSKYKKYKDILPLFSNAGISMNKFGCWVHEDGGYYAYCHKDGRLITRTGHGEEAHKCRTWSSVGKGVLMQTFYALKLRCDNI